MGNKYSSDSVAGYVNITSVGPTMRITLIKLSGFLLFSIILTLCTPLCVTAKENTKNEEQPSSVNTPPEQTPYTMEALLIGVREILTHPDEDGEEMAKKWLGIGKNEWSEISSPILTGDKKFVRERYLPGTPKPILCSAYLDDKNRLFNLEMFFLRDSKITAALTHKVFGEPSGIEILPCGDCTSWVIYHYENYTYPLYVEFLCDNSLLVKEEEMKKNAMIAKELYFYPNIHGIEDNYEEYLKSYHSGFSRSHVNPPNAAMPKTPEEVLNSLKGILDHIDEDGVLLFEKWFGFEKESWREHHSTLNTGEKKYIHHLVEDRPDPVFAYRNIYLNKDDKLFGMNCYVPGRASDDLIQEINPKTLYDLFGSPEKLEIHGYPSASSFDLAYVYHYKNIEIEIYLRPRTHDKAFDEYARKKKVYTEDIIFPEVENKKLPFLGFNLYFPENDIKTKSSYIEHPITEQDVWKRVPKTPETLLVSLKKLIENSQIADGRILCEEWLGIDRNKWTSTEKDYEGNSELKFSSSDYVEYMFQNLKILNWNLRLYESGKLKFLNFSFPFKDDILEITPCNVIKIFGHPDNISNYSMGHLSPPLPKKNPPDSILIYPSNETISYLYKGRNYALKFEFHNYNHKLSVYRSTIANTKENQIRFQMESVRKTTFNYHKNYKCYTTKMYMPAEQKMW